MRKLLFAIPLSIGMALFTACGSDSGSSAGGGGGGDGLPAAGCNFAKTDNVWKFKYSSYQFVEEYTWVDATTVEYKSYTKNYHNDKDDKTMTNQNRDELFEFVMYQCTSLQEM